jgi:hypothetical protein
MRIAFDYEPLERRIQPLACLDPEGKQLLTMDGGSLDSAGGGTVVFRIPRIPRFTLRVVYCEKSETITVPVRLETGVGF